MLQFYIAKTNKQQQKHTHEKEKKNTKKMSRQRRFENHKQISRD